MGCRFFSISSILFTALGGLLGIRLGFKIGNIPLREISSDTRKVIDLYKNEKHFPRLEGSMEELAEAIDLADKNKNIEILSKYLRSTPTSWYPVSHYALKNNLINPNDLYKVFLPSFDLGNNPTQVSGLRYLLSLLLENGLLNMEQIMTFIDGLIEESDIEVIWSMASNAPIEPTNKKIRGLKITDEAEDELSNEKETVNPNEAAHLMAYGNSKSWREDVIEYLTSIVKRGN